MSGCMVDEPVIVVDNGVRSFIPPTFCFELRAEDDSLVDTVSRVVLRDADLYDFAAVEELARKGLRAAGEVHNYDAGPQAQIPGKSFEIDRTVAVA